MRGLMKSSTERRYSVLGRGLAAVGTYSCMKRSHSMPMVGAQAVVTDLLGRILAARHPAKQFPGMSTGLVRRDAAMNSEADASRATAGPILEHIHFAPRGSNANAKAVESVVPPEIVGLRWLEPVDEAFGDARHSTVLGSIWEAGKGEIQRNQGVARSERRVQNSLN